jgi:hypothetical protein
MIPAPLIEYAASKRNTIKIVLLTLLISAGCFSAGSQNSTKTQFPEVELTPNQLVASPLVIDIHSKGVWMAHEGELGLVSVMDANGEKLATAIMKSKDNDWMRSGDAIFQAELQFEHPDTPDGKLVFENRLVTNEGNNQKETFEIPVRFYRSAVNTYYFGEIQKAIDDFSGQGFHLLKLELAADNSFSGTEIHAPSGTDGSKSALYGNFNGSLFQGKAIMLAEGELYSPDIRYQLTGDGINLGYKSPDGPEATLKKLSKEEYEGLEKQYAKNNLFRFVNTKDPERLKKMNLKDLYGFTSDDLAKMKFMELEIDLDGSYQTREFLVYLIHPSICGTGGCNLFIINEEGKIISKTTVVKLPVYTTVNRIVDQQNRKTSWKDLYVWSNGAFRKLIFKNSSYCPNASVAPAMAEENLVSNPQQFIKIMDYTDE